MRAARVVIAVSLLLALLAPELSRYRAERELRRLTSVAMAAATGGSGTASAGALLRETSVRLAGLSRAMPGDVRPRMYAASASLVARDTDRAIALYLEALRCGERGEVDVNLGRAFAAAGDGRAGAMFLRAVWISPKLIDSVPASYRDRVREEIARRTRAEAVSDPPPLPALPAAAAVLD
ncbi:MAG: hypothetical protein NDJ92_07575 [Thermoanaerobaculia bacterium]|nr:hypothetical protein [Thermoanaerobaculia bacterium]